jgi:hypothetical protein
MAISGIPLKEAIAAGMVSIIATSSGSAAIVCQRKDQQHQDRLLPGIIHDNWRHYRGYHYLNHFTRLSIFFLRRFSSDLLFAYQTDGRRICSRQGPG